MSVTRTVLLVDDDKVMLTLMQRILERHGYRVVTATDGNVALALAEREAPELVILDLLMPQRSGFTVVEKLKSYPNGGPRVIMITAEESDRHQVHARSLGVDDYVRKPFDAEQLLKSVRNLCPLQEEPPAKSS